MEFDFLVNRPVFDWNVMPCPSKSDRIKATPVKKPKVDPCKIPPMKSCLGKIVDGKVIWL